MSGSQVQLAGSTAWQSGQHVRHINSTCVCPCLKFSKPCTLWCVGSVYYTACNVCHIYGYL